MDRMTTAADDSAREQARRRLDEGNRLQGLGRLDEAQRCYESARSLDPSCPRAHVNVGNALLERGDVEGALAAYAEALKLDPAYAAAHFNSGNACWHARRLAAAAAHYERALALKPDFVDALVALGNVHDALGDLPQAEDCFRRALALRPDYAQVYGNLGNVEIKRRRWAAALAAFREMAAQRPDDGHAQAFAYFCALQACDWSDRQASEEALVDLVDRGAAGVMPFVMLNVETRAGSAGQLQRLAARNFALHALSGVLSAPPLRSGPRPGKDRLRIGYLSADFHEHATMHLLRGVLAEHDSTRLAVYLYSYGTTRDAATELAERSCERLRDLAALADREAAALIADDGIDILVDLKGFTTNARLQIAARRPAPVLVNWLGYPGTMGHPRLADYIVGDRVVTPLEHTADFSECLAVLPNCYQPNDRARPLGAAPARAETGLPETGAVLCSFNQGYKLSPGMFEAWCRILAGAPGSVLWLLDPGDSGRRNLEREARARGVDPQRLVFAPAVPVEQHLARLQLADLALDTYPYNSHTTASDALWAGVPLVTLKGQTFASRVAASLLTAAGAPELITADHQAFVDLALRLLRDPARLTAVRKTLASSRLAAPLFDTVRFTRDLERLYARMWEHALHGVRQPIILDA